MNSPEFHPDRLLDDNASRVAGAACAMNDPESTGPIRLHALLHALGLRGIPRPHTRPDMTTRLYGDPVASTELRCDDALAVARADEILPVLPPHARRPAWTVTLVRTYGLDAAPLAFAGTPSIVLPRGVLAQHHRHAAVGDTWWIPHHRVLVHHDRSTSRVGARYVHPDAARYWARLITAHTLDLQHLSGHPT